MIVKMECTKCGAKFEAGGDDGQVGFQAAAWREKHDHPPKKPPRTSQPKEECEGCKNCPYLYYHSNDAPDQPSPKACPEITINLPATKAECTGLIETCPIHGGTGASDG